MYMKSGKRHGQGLYVYTDGSTFKGILVIDKSSNFITFYAYSVFEPYVEENTSIFDSDK